MKKLIVKCQVELTDVYDDSWCPDPTIERITETLILVLYRCLSDKGTVNVRGVKAICEVLNNADD